MVFFTQCSNESLFPDENAVDFKAGKGGGGGGAHSEKLGNNLSFPVIASDGYTISSVNESFEVEYTGPYDGLTQEEIAALEENDPWYAQKVEGNVWQAEYSNANSPISVTFIDWGDVIESTNPVVGRPFRLETTMYVDVDGEQTMTGYTMAMLAFPSSPQEAQGTNNTTYESYWATVVSASPTLIIQHLDLDEGAVPLWSQDDGRWTGTGVGAPLPNFSFGPELNVGGKYIYGASQGGWRPNVAGTYRLTFFLRGTSNISFASSAIGNYAGNTDGAWGTPEDKAAAPAVDVINNLTYVDVTVLGRR